MAWIASLSFLARTPTAPPCCLSSQPNSQPNSFDVVAFIDLQGLKLLKYSSISSSTRPSRSSDLTVCHGKSSSLRGPLVAIATLIHTTPSMPPIRLPPRATVYRHRILQGIKHPYPTQRKPHTCLISTPTPVPGTNSVVAAPTFTL